ncbi:alpha-1-macroglobulin-like [Thamnophis elegans]|uniref:alpha-1-macroglobulin-like n=1 Tax=Thamnophis elegans TaxID=35005 RepID=UPI0013766A33|nr:alpha-1-macroglobulin-like [Thamnophis elegans]
MGESWQHGKNFFLLLLLSVLLRTTEAAPEPKLRYVALVPSTIHMETPENVCIQIKNLKGTVNFTLVLEPAIKDLILRQLTITEEDEDFIPDFLHCRTFQVPRESNISVPSEVLLEFRGNDLIHSFQIRKKVRIEKPKNLLFIQMDKPFYRTGQQVQFRIVSMDKKFHPMKKKFPVVYIQDPQNNQVFQWRDVEIPLGIIQLSYSLSSDSLLGTYKVVVEEDSTKVAEHSFDVDEYVMPKFEVLINAPKLITVTTEEIPIRVCGRYTNGKPVPGTVRMRVCRNRDTNENLCEEFEDEADGNGCFSKTVNMEPFHLRWRGFLMNIAVEGKVTEKGTGVEMNATEYIGITSTLSKIIFENRDRYYRLGIPYVVKVKLVDINDVPINNGTVEIFILTNHQWLKQVTDAQGRAEFSIETNDFTSGDFYFTASYQEKPWCNSEHWITPSHGRASHTVYILYSPSKSYLNIKPASKTLRCRHLEHIRVQYSLNLGDEKEDEIVFYYMMKSNENIVGTGRHRQRVEQGKETKGEFVLTHWIFVENAVNTQWLIYTILPSGELIADSRDFTVEKCFPDGAKLWFSDQEGMPGGETQLHISRLYDYICAIHAVDENVYLLKPDAEFSPEKFYSLFPKKDHTFSVDRFMDAFNLHPCPTEKPLRGERIGHPVHFLPEDGDAYKIFREFGLNIFTNTRLRIPGYCSDRDLPMEWEFDAFTKPGKPLFVQSVSPPRIDPLRIPALPPVIVITSDEDESAPKRTPRRFLPEPWIWEVVTVRFQEKRHSQGHSSRRKRQLVEATYETALPVTIPDTITKWKAGAFCLSERSSFELVNPTFLKVSQPPSNSE